jgi:hypothetical protein
LLKRDSGSYNYAIEPHLKKMGEVRQLTMREMEWEGCPRWVEGPREVLQ